MTSDINIVNGPSKFDLMTALFIWQPQRPEVEFTAENNAVFPAIINALESENGSGEDWIIRGFATYGNSGNSRLKFTGYYSTRARKGWLRFLK